MQDSVRDVYKQHWPFSSSNMRSKKEFQRPPVVSRPNSVTKRKRTTQRCPLPLTPAPQADDTRTDDTFKADDSLQRVDMATRNGFSQLNMNTLHRLGWSQEESGDTGQNEIKDDGDSLYKITKVEFRRFSEQVRDVSMNLKNRFRSSAYQKLYSSGKPGGGGGGVVGGGGGVGGGRTGDSLNQVYHSHLAASLKAFQHKQWLPLKHDEFEPTITRCRPISGRADRRPPSSRPSSAVPKPPQRPRSVPPGAYRPSCGLRTSETLDVTPGDFDTLSPNVLADLLGRSRITPHNFGDRVKDDDVSTSGIDSPNSDNHDSSSDSDSEPEPPVDSNRPVPQLQLRPEKLDAIYVPEDRRDRRRFDFDAEHVDIPAYEFETTLPEPFGRLDLKVIARQKYDWRDILSVRPMAKAVETILDRLVDIEKLQSETVEWETKRLRQRTKQRVPSAKSRDRRCCNNCLQPACVGDCPEKALQPNTCTLCRQQLCTGSCHDNRYEAYMRQVHQEEQIESILSNPVPRICITCQKKHNAKLINANNAILRRPKSGNTTYSRGRGSVKPRDLRPRSVTDVTSEIIKDIEKLGVEPLQPGRPNTGKYQRPRSRNSLLPGKSYFSNRKDSLTELEKARKRKLRSLRVKRPKSVV
ncbi:uncharacterized protein LOC125381653 isoform X2 [Haliotis rufescens]|uniref:uncharacterized protein LOC125381653 isoform X2 n=1 Tax=Haliotis rufescens TaxID=6454 RepID=UPI00201ED55B|nr:uncharacterized protein LOC125381653 isoform X2 [Haliotis rufescens]